MKKYTLVFKNGQSIDLSEEEYNKLLTALIASNNDPYMLFVNTDRTGFIRAVDISFAYLATTIEASSAVVKPPTPDQIREEREKAEQAKDVSLDAQLEGRV